MKVVFVNGCFDILHRGHFELLRYAGSLGGKVIVALDSDAKVSTDKGKDRPYTCLKDRKFNLSRLQDVDEIYEFSSPEELEQLTKQIKPDIMVVGSDWRGRPIVGSEHATEVKYFERINGHSTTNILQHHRHR
jgi:rfaE bifunctional protein nucleotidyltransferase chain/domain